MLTIRGYRAGVVCIGDAVVVCITLVGSATEHVHGQAIPGSRTIVYVVGDFVSIAVFLRRGTALSVSVFRKRRVVANIARIHHTVLVGVSFGSSATYAVHGFTRCGGRALVAVIRDGVAVRVELTGSASCCIHHSAQRGVGASIEGVHDTVVVSVLLTAGTADIVNRFTCWRVGTGIISIADTVHVAIDLRE